MNIISLTGRLTRDPELRDLPQDGTVCDLRLAVDGMGRGREVGFIDVAVFGKPGEAAARVLSQGWLVAVHGRLVFREWEATDGGKRSAHSVVGNVEFLAAPRREAEPTGDRAGDGDRAAAEIADIGF
jgi:single-strand DNA-binding protein